MTFGFDGKSVFHITVSFYSKKEDAWLEITWRDAEFGKKAGHIFAAAWEYVTWGAVVSHFDKDGNEFESDGTYRTKEEEAQDAAEWAEIDAEFKAKEQARQQRYASSPLRPS